MTSSSPTLTLSANATGSNNTYLGYEAGYGVSGQNNSNNIGIGNQSLKTIRK